MARLNLHLVVLLQFIVLNALAQGEAPAPPAPTAVETSSTPPTVATAATGEAAAVAPPPKPKPKPQSVCKIFASNGYSSVYWNNRVATRATNDIRVTISQLKKFVESKVCKPVPQECSLLGREGKSALFIDKEPDLDRKSDAKSELDQFKGRIGEWNDGPALTIQNLKALKESKICKMIVPTYSVLNLDGRFAAYADANRVSDYSYEKTEAEKVLFQFTKALEDTSGNSFENLISETPSNNESEQNKIKNIQCWKGDSLPAQDRNLKLCQKKMKTNQNCEISLFLHNESAFDVCLQGFVDKPTRMVECFKNQNKNQQQESIPACRDKLMPGQICESDAKIHGQGRFHVCIME